MVLRLLESPSLPNSNPSRNARLCASMGSRKRTSRVERTRPSYIYCFCSASDRYSFKLGNDRIWELWMQSCGTLILHFPLAVICPSAHPIICSFNDLYVAVSPSFCSQFPMFNDIMIYICRIVILLFCLVQWLCVVEWSEVDWLTLAVKGGSNHACRSVLFPIILGL